jgi:tetratricopeptide (TPR) repeat protein
VAALAEGYKALQQGQWPKAAAAFSAVLQRDAGNLGAILGLAEAELKSGRPTEAEALLRRALKLAPDNADVLVAQGRFLESRGEFDSALPAFRKAIELQPANYSAQRALGDLYLNGLKQPELAISAYKRAAELMPEAVPPRFGMALGQLAAGRKEAALAQLEETARLAPQAAELPHLIGRIQASDKRFVPALAAMDRALAINPDFLPAVSDRADIHSEAGHDALAVADYEHLLKLTPDNATARLKLGMAYHRMGRYDDAQAAYLAALKRNQNLAVAYNNLAMINLHRNGSASQAVGWAKKAVELSPQVPQFHDTLGWSHRAQGDLGRACAAMEDAVRLGPGQPELAFRLGTVYEQAGRKADARKAYQRAVASPAAFAQLSEAKARLAALGP